LVPSDLHQRVPLILGCKAEVERIEQYHHLEHDQGWIASTARRLFKERSLFIQILIELALEGTIMSAKHPIIAVTGSSGAGTTSVSTHLQLDLSPRKHQRRDGRGRFLSSLRSRGNEASMMAEAAARATTTSVTSVRQNNLFEELEALFSGLRRDGPRQDPPLSAQ
jgi:hypothetical protein